jgi:hypothetical protein
MLRPSNMALLRKYKNKKEIKNDKTETITTQICHAETEHLNKSSN